MNKQQLAARIWASANKMRSKIDANEYKDYILGFIFYKFLSDQTTSHMLALGADLGDLEEALTEDDHETVESLKHDLGYFISYENLYSTWLQSGRSFDVSNVVDALNAFDRSISHTHEKVFDGIFDTLQSGLSKLGENGPAQTKAVRELLDLIKDIPTNAKQGYDVLGFVYEYLLEHFAANAGKKAGEFYTPHEVSMLMSEIVADHLKDRETISIYDPTSGSGSLLLNIGTAIARHRGNADHIAYYAQELKKNTYNLTRMNLVMRGVKPANIRTRNADTLEEDWPDTDDPLHVDAVVSNPPYSAPWDPSARATDPRYAKFGLAPKSKADYAFVLHDLFHMQSHGIATVVLPHGVLFRGGEEGKIRRELLERNHIDAIIGLPANIFFGTGIPTIIMILKKERQPGKGVLIVDASRGFVKNGKDNVLRARDIRKIAETVIQRKNVDKYSRIVSLAKIRENEYNLNIPRYVNSADPAETWDIYASMFGGVPEHEIDDLGDYWDALPGLRERLFVSQGNGYSHATSDPAQVIAGDVSVAAFRSAFSDAFSGFRDDLVSALVYRRHQADAVGGEAAISANIFQRLARVPLVDEYAAYQLLHDQWTTISGDLEMIQTEGETAIRRVDPHMVTKKVKNKETEVQDGWAGRILPFELVQAHVLAEESTSLREAEERLVEAEAGLHQLLESLSDEDKLDMSDMLNIKNDAFVVGGVNQIVKDAKKERKDGIWPEGSPQAVAHQARDLLTAKSTLSKVVKEGRASLHLLTKQTIESLTEEQILELLIAKWVTPLIENLNEIPVKLLDTLAQHADALSRKYATTFADISEQATVVKFGLTGMISELTGSEVDMRALDNFSGILAGKAR